MIVLAAALAITAFLIGFSVFGVVPAAKGAVALAGSATGTIRDKSLSDDEKEAAVQKAALGMLRASGSIFWRVAATLIATVAPIYLMDLLGLVSASAVFGFLARVDVIIGATVLVSAGLWLNAKRPKSTSAYSLMDRVVHRIAFAAPFVQMAAADMEDTAFAAQTRDIEDKPPVFITSLPRAGTTVVLNALHDVPGVATHLYRDMPFIMAPLFWSKISSGFRKDATLAERAHGDGLQVGYDSPEAFEEVIWRAFWPDHFKGSTITPWASGDTNSDATAFFRKHFRKIIALRHGPGGRYVSKNNGNIARLALLGQMFPDSTTVVPLRHPGEHAASLLRQHQNFLTQHHQDPFIKRYMHDIGHLEFGALHQPIAFEGLSDLTAGLSPDQPDYWLAYWIAAHRSITEHADKIIIAPETALQSNGQAAMGALCEKIGIDPAGTDFARHFKVIPKKADPDDFDKSRFSEAMALYDNLSKTGMTQLGF